MSTPTAPTGPDADGLPVDVSMLLAELAEIHGRQLADVNLEAAKWRAASRGAAAELATLRTRVDTLEARLSAVGVETTTANGNPTTVTVGGGPGWPDIDD